MKSFKIKQHDNRDCGPACLANICSFYGKKVPLVEIREKMKVSKSGVSLYAIAETAREYEFEAEVLKGTIDEFVEETKMGTITMPTIVHIITQEENGHFIIVRKISKKNVYFFDPGNGASKIGKDKFEKLWSGYLVNLKSRENFKKEDRSKKYLKKYLKIFAKQKKLLIGAIIISIILATVSTACTMAYQVVVDDFILQNGSTIFQANSRNIVIQNMVKNLNAVVSNCIWLFLALILLYLIQMFLMQMRGFVISRLGKKVYVDITDLFFEKLIQLPIEFYSDRETGEILSRLSDIEEVKDIFSRAIISIVLNCFMVVSSGIILVNINIHMFTMVIVLLWVYSLVVLINVKPIKKIKKEVLEDNSRLLSNLKETIDQIEHINCLNVGQKRVEQIKRSRNKLAEEFRKTEIILINQSSILSEIQRIGKLALLMYGCGLVVKGIITFGNLIVFESLLNFFLEPVQQLIEMQIEMQGAVVALERLDDVLEVTSEKVIFNGEKSTKIRDEKITITNLEFSYGYEETVLKGISTEIEPGEKVAIIGENGCGKSTLARILAQLYSYKKGSIKIGNCELKEIKLEVIRQKIRYVSQESELFAGSIKENLFINLQVKNEMEIKQIIEGCRVMEILSSLTYGIETKITEGGKELSGGQRQRIILAQAILSKPEILIIDEGTSHLDKKCELDVFQFIKEYCQDITCFFVLHDRNLADLCSKRISINDGRVE